MNNWKINKTVDLARGIDGVEVWPHALLVTGDENAHEWNVTVMDNGKPASLGGSIRAYFVRSDGATVTAAGSVAGNVATVTLPEACYAYEGDLSAVMQLIGEDVTVTLSALLLRVRQISTDVIVDPGTEIPSLDDLLAQIENMKQATKDANTATTNANQAAANAETRVDEAISEAEGRVDTAVQSAETATSKANASASAADASKAAADTAANAANEAADRANKAASGVGIRKKVVEQLPDKAEMEQDVLYLVRRAEPNAENVYDEYMLINGEVEAIGSTKTDLEDYATKDYVGEQIDGIQIGGRNYWRHSGFENAKYYPSIGLLSNNIEIVNGHGVENGLRIHRSGYEGIERIVCTLSPDDSYKLKLKAGEQVTLSFWVRRDGDFSSLENCIDLDNNITILFGIYIDNENTKNGEWTYIFDTYTPEKDVEITNYRIRLGRNGDMIVSNIKLERGNKPTDWTPAPEDVDAKIDSIVIGGRNIALNSRRHIENTDYMICEYGLSSYKPDEGDICTLQIKGNLGQDRVHFGAYNTTGNVPLAETLSSKNENGIYYATFKWTNNDQYNHMEVEPKTIRIYQFNKDGTSASTIEWVKLERGNKATDWSPAPEDNYIATNNLGVFSDAASGKQAIYDWVVSLKNQSNMGGYGMTLFGASFPKDEETLGQLYSGLFLLIGFSNHTGSYAGILAISYWQGRRACHATIENNQWAGLFQPI